MKNKRNTKMRIVSAAWELFYQQGYDDTTVDEIVEKSETSKGSFYHYFPSKDALLGSLAYLFDNRYAELEDSLDPDENRFSTLLYLNRELFDLIDNRIDRNLLVKLYSTQLVRRGEKSLLDDDRLYYRLLRKTVAEGQARGELSRELSAAEIVRLYAICERALIYEWCLSDYSFSLRSYSEMMLPRMLAGIRGESA